MCKGFVDKDKWKYDKNGFVKVIHNTAIKVIMWRYSGCRTRGREEGNNQTVSKRYIYLIIKLGTNLTLLEDNPS